jgi:hypothetical protein
MIFRIMTLFTILLGLSTNICLAKDIPLETEDNKDLVYLLNQMTILAERIPSGSDPFAYVVRIILISEPGECGSTLEDCPKQYVYIAISDIGENPDMKLYKLPESYGWELNSDIQDPHGESSPEKFVIITMTRTILSKDKSKYEYERYSIHANNHNGFMHKLP